ncbi:MAG: aminotransferase class III-fold pyridoxal phosphate-dependent enzyme [Rhodothermales bacterium]|nr:aminotransferase class III-fold pyridoxal phosphate-dependent enzyme [Rhodothermales bacterium]
MSAEQILRNNLDYTLFSWSPQGNLHPINMHRAEGVYLFDRDGKRYIDFSSQLMNVNIGHGHPRVQEAVAAQMKEISYAYPGMATEARGLLGKKLAEITPGKLSKTFFTLGGAEAVENAIKLARVYSGRSKIISLYRSYHGGTYAAMSAGGDPRKHAIDALAAPNFVHVENPYYYRCPWNSTSPEECAQRAADHMERVIQFENPSSVAAILMEGESGSSGCIKYPPGYWQRVSEIAKRYGILTICDEVMSGFGRTGKMFAIEHHDVEPDIMCMAKGLTAGYIPLGAVITTPEIAGAFDDRPLPLGLTYSAHPVACAAALAVLDVYDDEDLVSNAKAMGAYINEEVCELAGKHASLGDFRNTGLLGCIELVRDKDSREPLVPWNASAADSEPTRRIAAMIREAGMFTFVRWNWIFIAPPLCVTTDQVDEGLAIISNALNIADEYSIA